MKKIISYILIFVVIAQLFAPLSEIGNGLKIVKAEAADNDFSLSVSTSNSTDKTVSLTFVAYANSEVRTATLIPSSSLTLVVNLNDLAGTNVRPEQRVDIASDPNNFKVSSVIITANFTGLSPSTSYNAIGTIESTKDGVTTTIAQVEKPITTIVAGQTNPVHQGTSDNVGEEKTDGLPTCSIIPMKIGGCIAQLIYYLFFKTTSFIFGLAGKIMDFTIKYSIDDSSYRSTFVVQGWGIVRDFCNMFFIFVLIYIALGTILKLHGVKTKEMIINVVIIGLLINFSLFATQVIIDASNILTRVFYNQKTIVTGVKDPNTGVISSELGEFKEIKLSEAIVSKVDPQKLIIQASEVNKISQKSVEGEEEETYGDDNISVGSFILVTLLATIVNIVGIIAFITSAMVFIARVIGLWLAMILAPIAFFSYTVPALKDMELIGWTKWWPETLRLAFLAPIFAFFMYLIVGFMPKALDVFKGGGTDQFHGLNFVVSIIVPFVFIMILLMRAKDIAKSMSGKIGQSITGGVAAAGGLVLGGAALGTAFLGRKMIGGGLASASRTEGAVNRGTQRLEYNKKLEEWKAKGKMGVKPTWDNHVTDYETRTGKKLERDLRSRLGAKLNEKQMKVGEVDHARHEIDEAKKSAGLEGVADANLSGVNEKKIKDAFMKGKKSEIESDIRRGYDAKKDISLINNNGSKVLDSKGQEVKGEEQYKKVMREKVEGDYIKDNNLGGVKDLTDKDKKNIENQLNADFNVVLKATLANESEHKFEHIRDESKQRVGGVERAISRANSGSYDVRNLSDIKSDKREGLFTKVPVALIAGIATGVRAGMKNVGTSNGGVKVQGDFMKDLSSVVSDSLKSAKVSVDISGVGEHKSSADSHGGGGGHH